METVQIVGHQNLVRDIASKALLNTDTGAMERYKYQTRIFDEAKKKTDDINQMKQEMAEIKALLLALLHKD